MHSPYDSLQRVYCLQALCGNLKGHHHALCHGHASLAGSNPEIIMQVMSLVTCPDLLEHCFAIMQSCRSDLQRICSVIKGLSYMQVISLVTCPSLLEHPKVGELYPADAIARAKQCLTYFSGGLGAYTDSR